MPHIFGSLGLFLLDFQMCPSVQCFHMLSTEEFIFEWKPFISLILKLAYCFCRRYTLFGNILVFSFADENKYLFERKQCFDVSENSYQLH